MESIGMMRLKNHGGFVVRLEFEYYHESSKKWIHVRGTGDITLWRSKQVNPGDYGVPGGSMIRLHANVLGGTDKVSNEMFIYEQGNSKVAKYTISGTTLNSYLAYDSLELLVKLDAVADGKHGASCHIGIYDFTKLADEEREEVKSSLENPALAQSGSWGVLSWNAVFNKDRVDVTVSVLDIEIANVQLNAENLTSTIDLTVAGIGVKAELSVDFTKRIVRLRGTLNFVITAKDFDLVILNF